MKKFFWRALFFLIPFLYSIYVCSQPPGKKDCSTTCFSSEVISVDNVSATCKTYRLRVSYSGPCAHALSHYSIAVPCGEIKDVWNSENWKHSIGTDPTTGLSGLKIDDIPNFGEGGPTSFDVKFTICSAEDACNDQLKCWQPLVAYKASTCVNYETVNVNCSSLKASLQHRDASCFGAEDGSLSVVIEDGLEPFTFLWSDNSTEQTLEGAKAGAYSVTVRDASGAEQTLAATIQQPEQIAVEGVVSPASCSGKSDGAIELTVSGGNAPYTFNWNHGSDAEDVSALAAGQYFVTVNDNNNCSATARFTVPNTSALSLTVNTTAPDCNGTNGSIDLAVTGGQAPYSFEWSNGAVTEDLSNAPEGLYSVIVTDNSGCSAQRTIFLKENNSLNVKGVSTPASCAGDATGNVDLTVSGGTAPYKFTWSNGSSSEDLSNVANGFYTVTIEDSKGCTVTASYTVTTKTFQVPRTVVPPSCDGEANGSITLLEPIGGTAPYTYTWSNGESGQTLTDLQPGSYTVTVTDATGCSRTLSLSISAPTPIVATASVSPHACNEDGSSSIDLTVSGGTEPYTYQWSNGASTEDIEVSAGGTYTVIVTDAKGCSISKEIIIEVQTPLSCIIDEPAAAPGCGSIDNVLSTSVLNADSYIWTVQSSDNSWTITTANGSSIIYSAGSANSTATFTLTMIKDGCTKTCSYDISACIPDQGEEDPEGEVPGDGDPDGETPGNEDGQNCNECFSSVGTLISSTAECRTYELQVNTNGLCAHELSHWTIAIPCGNITNYSNSGGWKMEIGQDPTTGLYGLKVDDISGFGKQMDSFTVRFTLCEPGCDLGAWSPVVAYKAGQCVAKENVPFDGSNLSTNAIAIYPNPFSEVIRIEAQEVKSQVSFHIIDQFGNVVIRSNSVNAPAKTLYLELQTSSLPKGMYYYRMTVDGRVHNGKLSKR